MIFTDFRLNIFGNFLTCFRKFDWKTTDVPFFWNLTRNPEKNHKKFAEKNAKFGNFAIEYLNFRFFFIFSVEFCIFSANFLWIFSRISCQIPEKSDVCRFSIKFAKTNSKIIAEIFEICENYSILFNIIQSCP